MSHVDVLDRPDVDSEQEETPDEPRRNCLECRHASALCGAHCSCSWRLYGVMCMLANFGTFSFSDAVRYVAASVAGGEVDCPRWEKR